MSYDLWGRLRYMLSPQFDIYEQVAKVVSGNVLDVGSGTGFGTHLLARTAKYVVGYEVDGTAMEFADRAFSSGNISFSQVDITNPIGPAGYDFVIMIDVIEHIRDAKLAIKNCRNLLDASGTFICSTPNRMSRYRKSTYHVREYSPKELKDLLGSVFDMVGLVDFRMQPIESDYINPILAVCQ